MKGSLDIAPALTAGRPWPLGAHIDATGVNLAVYSAHAQAIEWCLFDPSGMHETARHPLVRSGDVWHAHLAGAGAGLVYGLRAHGPWRPEEGHRFNPHKLLLDPHARDVVGHFDWSDLHFAVDRLHPQRMDHRDNAALALKTRVVDEHFDWGSDRSPRIAPIDAVIYEVHVKSFSRLNPQIPEPLRGTYAGLSHAASIEHLRMLGVTSLCLLPVHFHLDEERLVAMGLRNHWGYNTLGFFCVEPRYASGAGGLSPRDEFKAMVKALHAAGFEVLLDVVFNHTAESDETGPNLSFRGLDNASYYRLPPESPAHYENHAGCGNTLDIRQPAVLQLVMDSLRHGVTDMHVDGFRFDLAPVLGRGDHGFNRDGAFFGAVAQDPVLSRVKMIAEPWDIGPGGYQVGGFPRGWHEWNDHFRDAMRAFWLRPDIVSNHRATFARRLSASSDLFHQRRRSPLESINYVVSHDGFTLRDLVSYAERHNQANGEGNRDGHGHNLSVNGGIEGPTDDAEINALRGRLQRALLATTLLAQGTPMLAAGDELGHTQRGNNNPYCQDNEITWIAWQNADADLCAYTARLVELRRTALPFGADWYSGLTDPLGLHDLTWLRESGDVMDSNAWHDAASRVLGCLIGRPGRARAPLLLLVNGGAAPCDFMLPAGVWRGLLDSAHPRGASRWHGQGEAPITIDAHSLMLLAAAGANVD